MLASMASVSVLIPARNEAEYIGACLDSIFAQRFEGELEVLVADGDSDDATAELSRAAGARVVANPQRITPAALNRAFAAARGDVIVRFDAHAEMGESYIASCLRALEEEPGMVNIGGWREARGVGPWGRATGAALGSRLGVGNPKIWRRPSAPAVRREVDTVPLGCWRRSTLELLGGWNEHFFRHEDFELNYRLRRSGGRVVLDPAITSTYRPRESLRALSLQYWHYGAMKARMVLTHPDSVRPRQLAPFGLLAAATIAPFQTLLAWPGRAALLAYGLLVAGVTLTSRAGWRTAPALATMHLSWTAGVIHGLLRPRDWRRLAEFRSVSSATETPSVSTMRQDLASRD
jgi:succinoglycan biosynthesis protein ExoA